MPRVGETIHGYKFKNGWGGKGSNQCVAARKLNSKVAFVGKLGSDTWGNSYKQHFLDEGVNVDHLEIVEGQVRIKNSWEIEVFKIFLFFRPPESPRYWFPTLVTI